MGNFAKHSSAKAQNGLNLSERQELVNREEKVGSDHPEYSGLMESWDVLWQWESNTGF